MPLALSTLILDHIGIHIRQYSGMVSDQAVSCLTVPTKAGAG